MYCCGMRILGTFVLFGNKKGRQTDGQKDRRTYRQTDKQIDTRRLVLKKTVFLRGRVR